MNVLLRAAALLPIFCLWHSGSQPADKPRSKWLMVKVTAYCPCKICCGRWADGKTAYNRDAFKAGVAVDPKVIPLGSHLDIPGYDRGPNGNGSWILADDVGNSIKGKHIDIRFKTHQEALDWGSKYLKIRVWE